MVDFNGSFPELSGSTSIPLDGSLEKNLVPSMVLSPNLPVPYVTNSVAQGPQGHLKTVFKIF